MAGRVFGAVNCCPHECHIVDQCSKPVLPLGRVEVFCPVDPIDLSEDVIVGRAILNRLTVELNGKLAKLFPSDIIK
jgi:hypothetical protein